MKYKFILAITGLAAFLASMTHAVLTKETILTDGQEIYMTIGPRDPRSLMQGDYMRLAYDRALRPKRDAYETQPYKGTAILTLDKNRVATLKGFHASTFNPDSNIKVTYRRTQWSIRYTALSFFFQEGKAKHFEQARYIIVRVGTDGSTLITGLADDKFTRL